MQKIDKRAIETLQISYILPANWIILLQIITSCPDIIGSWIWKYLLFVLVCPGYKDYTYSFLEHRDALTQCHSSREWWESLHIFRPDVYETLSSEIIVGLSHTEEGCPPEKYIACSENKVSRCCLVEILISSCSGSGENGSKIGEVSSFQSEPII